MLKINFGSVAALMVCGKDLRTRPVISRGTRFKKNLIMKMKIYTKEYITFCWCLVGCLI
ncbi:hypothetical protein HanXRQr2_Chr06g0253121 [Helianthus annuus]|uniref:Uncharacterized protein n=1 Tax=Helianthus annuus TaxID=4232 RepID=A0A9K3IS59_HELAN|nr:hypothetical protein HanXRQr2_Chr06g0253121 [Helianthus annuus]